MRRFGILDRIDCALEKFALRQMTVRAIYLTVEDHDALDRAMSWNHGRKVSVLSYGEHEIRRGLESRIYSDHGVEVRIPKRLSPKVRELDRAA